MKHPDGIQLALWRELDWPTRWRISRHLRQCTACASEVRSFEASERRLREMAGEMPPGLNWDALAAEMTGNVRVGIAAGRCVAPAVAPGGLSWRTALVFGSTALLLITALWLNPPLRKDQLATRGIVLATTPSGIELKENGSALTLMHVRSEKEPLVVSAPGSLRVRYVDSETGQITINNVYAQ